LPSNRTFVLAPPPYSRCLLHKPGFFLSREPLLRRINRDAIFPASNWLTLALFFCSPFFPDGGPACFPANVQPPKSLPLKCFFHAQVFPDSSSGGLLLFNRDNEHNHETGSICVVAVRVSLFPRCCLFLGPQLPPDSPSTLKQVPSRKPPLSFTSSFCLLRLPYPCFSM